MQKILFISIDALFPVLFWGNVISLLFLLIYYKGSKIAMERSLILYLIVARACHAFYYFVASGRGLLPDLLSVSVGNSLMLVGFYMEAEAIMRIIREESKRTTRQLQVILITVVALFNLFEWITPSGGVRIAFASFGNVAIMLLPVFRMFLSRNTNAFAKPVAVLNGLYLFSQLLRVGYGLRNPDVGVLDSVALSSVSFLALMLQLIISLPAYVLIIKSYADEALVRMATTDKLTGATNRYAFLDDAVAVWRQCNVFAAPVSVLYLDIDHFKLVNDTYGHAFGDVVLMRLTKILESCVRKNDLYCRYGGEEFVILLSRSDAQAARHVSERIMAGVRTARFPERPIFPSP